MHEIDIWPYCQMLYAQPRIRSEEWDTQISWDFEMQSDHMISVRRTDRVIVIKKEILSVDHTVEIKENEKRDKYLDLASETRRWW